VITDGQISVAFSKRDQLLHLSMSGQIIVAIPIENMQLFLSETWLFHHPGGS